MADNNLAVKITAEASQFHAALKEVEHAIHALVSPISGLRDQFLEIGEVAGITLLADKIKEVAVEASEAAEKAVNMGAALGISAEQYNNLAGALSIVGMRSETLVRSFYALGRSADEALKDRSSEKAFAFRQAQIDAEKFRETLNGPDGVDKAIDILAEAYKRLQESGGNVSSSGPLGQILNPRGFAEFVKGIRGGTEGLAELRQQWASTSPLQEQGLQELDKLAEKFHLLAAAVGNFSQTVALSLSGPLGSFSNWLTSAFSDMSKLMQLGRQGLPTGIPEVDNPSGEPGIYTGGGVKDQIAGWLAAQGYVGNSAAAIMGNISAESNYNPGASGPGGHFGLFQWDTERQKSLGGSTDVVKQMELMDQELSKLDPAFKSASGSVEELTKRFEKVFERSGGQAMGARVHGAEEAAGSSSVANEDYHAWTKAKDAYDDYIKKTQEGGEREVAEIQRQIALVKAKGDSIEEQKTLYANLADARQRMMAEEDRATEAFRKKGGEAAEFVTKKYKDHIAQRIQADTAYINETTSLARRQFSEQERGYSETVALDQIYLKTFESNAEEMVRKHQISRQQQYGFDLQYAAQLHEQERKILEDMIQNDNLTVEQKRRLYMQLLQLDAKYEADRAALNTKTTADIAKQSDEWNNRIAGGLSSALMGVITGRNTVVSAFASLGEEIGKVFLDNVFKDIGKGLFGTLFGGLASGGGIFGTLFGGSGIFSGLGALFALERGGVMPSAAGGWVVPSFQSGGILAKVHENEMVLPANISQGFQDMLRNGSPPGGGGATINIHAWDTQTGAQALMRNAPAVGAAFKAGGLYGGISPRMLSSGGRYP